MKIRKSTLSDESDVKALWGYCFEPPTDPFFQWYFKELAKPEEILLTYRLAAVDIGVVGVVGVDHAPTDTRIAARALSGTHRSWNLRYSIFHASAPWVWLGSKILTPSVLDTAIGAVLGQMIQFMSLASPAGSKPNSEVPSLKVYALLNLSEGTPMIGMPLMESTSVEISPCLKFVMFTTRLNSSLLESISETGMLIIMTSGAFVPQESRIAAISALRLPKIVDLSGV